MCIAWFEFAVLLTTSISIVLGNTMCARSVGLHITFVWKEVYSISLILCQKLEVLIV